MTFIIGFLSFVLLLISLSLIFLVLIQLPKKDAGVGVAFGGGATDALFGAGSGNVLTKATKYAATGFFVLALIVGMMQSAQSKKSTLEFERAVEKQADQPETTTAPPATPGAVPAPLMSQPAAAPVSTTTSAPAPAQN